MRNRRSFLAQSLGMTVVGSLGMLAQSPPSGRPRKAAVIGHTGRGDYGHGLELIFKDRPQAELVALVDPDEGGRRSTGRRIGAPRLYADFREMLQVERPSLVSVALRQADQHHAICRAALEAGAHLYVEKPFTCTPEEADDLLDEAARRRLKIAVAHTLRLAPKVVLFRQALREGLIGDLVELRAYGKQDARAGGEDLMVLGTHLFDLMRMAAGDPLNCSARVRWQGQALRVANRRKVKDDVGWVGGDEVSASFEFPGGVIGSFVSHAQLRETVGHWGLELYGSRGVARINSDSTPQVFIRSSTAWTAAGRSEHWQPLETASVKVPPPPPLDPVGDWLDAIDRDRAPECSARNAAWAIEMVMAVYASALRGGPVAFPLPSRKHPLSD